MKKVFVWTILVITIVVCTFAHAEEHYYGDLRDHCIPELIDDFNEKYEGGDIIFENGYSVINDFCIYCTEGRIYLSDFGMDINNYSIKEVANQMTELLREAGLDHATVHIIRVGYEPDYPVYRVCISTMTNMNEWSGNDKVGNGFIKDGLVYYWVDVLCAVL